MNESSKNASNTLIPLNKDLTYEELRKRLEELIQVLKVLLKYSSDKTELATFLSTGLRMSRERNDKN